VDLDVQGPDDGELLLIPGPVTVTERVRAALAGPVRAHYGDQWVERYGRVTRDLAAVFQTAGDVFLVYAPGRAAMEMALASTLGPGDEVLVVGGGYFAELAAEIGAWLGLRVSRVRPEGYRPVTASAVEASLADDRRMRAVVVVHHETDLGLVNPVREICGLARRRGALTVVDAISSLGGIALEMDAWDVDVCVSVANKCLGGPVGVSPVAVGPRGWEAVDDGRAKAAGWYLNLATWRRYLRSMGDWHPHPATVPTGAIAGLGAAVDEVLEEGLAARLARHARAARRTREGLEELGFEMLAAPEWASPVTTAVWAWAGMDVADYQEWLRRPHRLLVGGGLGELSGRIFRVGHMGVAADPAVVDAFLRATADYVAEKGLAGRGAIRAE
jgi:alanine-glyoxylate transaminase / serine-glyoxylate transaminase / serine-pyruvate transaminase